MRGEVNAGQRLRFTGIGQTTEGYRSRGQNRTRENRPSGIEEGACGNVSGGIRLGPRGKPWRVTGLEAARAAFLPDRRPRLSQGRFALQEQIVRYTWDRAFGDWEVREMTALEVLQSVQYVTVKGKRLAVVGAEDWEVVIEWLETLEDIEAAREAHEALKAAGGDRDRAGWLRWDEVKEELA